MKLLLDTHAFIWACVEPERLSKVHREGIASVENEVYVSAASAWEISIKSALGRLEFPQGRFEDILAGMGFLSLPMTASHALAAGRLPRHHDDPFDRMLIAQAQLEGHSIVTVDRRISSYEVALFGH